MQNDTKLLVLLLFTLILFLAELSVGWISGSIALLADSFHMVKLKLNLKKLSDFFSILIAIFAHRWSKAAKTMEVK